MVSNRFKIYLASPRGFCAGVDRAIDIVELALKIFGPPVYVRHAIVHNRWVVNQLKEKGAVFVEDIEDIPEGAVTVFSAHGVSPQVRENAKKRKLKVIDATCPLVTKVHMEAKRFAKEGYTILLVGHKGHVEVEGTMGEAPDRIILIETPEDAEKVQVPDPQRVAVITQTTLSVDDTREIIEILRKRFPAIETPKADDICYATQNRQDAVKELVRICDLILVIGSKQSSNSNRLREVAEKNGVTSYLVSDETEIAETWLKGIRAVGITSGASTPEFLVERVINKLKSLGGVGPFDVVKTREHVTFALPPEIRNIKNANA